MQKSFSREGTGISNLDGRLWNEVGVDIARYFSDKAMVQARILVEARYLIALSKAKVIRKLKRNEENSLLNLNSQVTDRVYLTLRKIEANVRHDVVAMTQVMKKILNKNKSLKDIINQGWIHWGLGSEDVDNIARSVMIKNFLNEVYIPQFAQTLKLILVLARKTKNIVIPGKTHLQTAIPTILGKEIAIYGIRLGEYFEKIRIHKLRGKISGDIGNLSAHKIALPNFNWRKISKDFVESFGFESNSFTTQIDSRAKLIELFQLIQNVNSILIDMSQDFRLYIGFNWFTQEVKEKEAGSSAMPHKVNPIDFENSQGNALFSNWILEGLIRQLPVSWLQRDLVDKTILRNLGLPFGYSLIALISANKGLSRITPNTRKIKEDLESDWAMLAEAFQSILRVQGKGQAYEELKKLSRGKKLARTDIENWIRSLNIKPAVKQKLAKITFENYTGYAQENLASMLTKIDKFL